MNKKLSYEPNLECRHFKGDIPCEPHKQHQVVCTCDYFEKRGLRILIIKLGAMGDVIRTTPVLRKLKKLHPDCEITWISCFPEVLPSLVDRKWKLDIRSVTVLQAENFDQAYNFDKDLEACALLNLVQAKVKKGFMLLDGRPSPIDHDSLHKFWTGIDDNFCKKDTWSYPKEIFRMAGWEFQNEEYVIDPPEPFPLEIPGVSDHEPIIGLNTGCGTRWLKRLWPEEHWVQLAKMIVKKGGKVVLLGGPDEDQKNRRIAEQSGASYLGVFTLPVFFSLVNCCDIIVTAVSLAMHVAMALKKKLILFVNVFPKEEFELYGLGKIIQPKDCCKDYYTSSCDKPCMETILPEQVYKQLEDLMLRERVGGKKK